MEFEISDILEELAQNERKNYRVFKERLTEYCEKETAVRQVYRLLKDIERELNDCLTGRNKVNVERAMVVKVLKTIRSELDIIRYKMKFPGLMEFATTKPPCPAGNWTDDKIDLVELIYAIVISIDNGHVTLKALQDCFEYIFQVKLGNISDRFNKEIKERQGNKVRYLERLIKNLHELINS